MELMRAELALVAARLALPFADTDMLTDLEVDETIRLALEPEGRASNPAAVMTACDRLYGLGYIWPAGGESGHSFRPGIPSLMPYVERSSNIHVGSESE